MFLLQNPLIPAVKRDIQVVVFCLIGKPGDIVIDDRWGLCPMMMMKNGKKYIGTVCHGKSRTLQAPGSEVSLEIPEGSKGVYVMGVHTDVLSFNNVVDDEECFVSPVVEIIHKKEDDDTEPEYHTIRVPHCLSDTSQLQLIRVRRGRSSNSAPFQLIPPVDKNRNIDCFSVDKSYVTIYSKKFSDFVCTTCNTTCQGTIQMFLFGKLNSWQSKNVTTAQMKSFLCSPLFKISEFRDVFPILFFQNI